MISKNYILGLSISITILLGCSHHTKQNLSTYRLLTSALTNSCNLIAEENTKLFKQMDQKAQYPATAVITSIWRQKAESIRIKTEVIMQYIDSLKTILKQNSNLHMQDGQEIFEEDDYDAVANTFIENKNAEELKAHILKYENDVLEIDTGMKSTSSYSLNTIVRISDLSEKTKNFSELFFSDLPTIGALAILRKFQNNISILENHLLNYCFSQIPS